MDCLRFQDLFKVEVPKVPIQSKFDLMIHPPLSIVLGSLIGNGDMSNSDGTFTLLLIGEYWWFVYLLSVVGDHFLDIILDPSWSGWSENTYYCYAHIVQVFLCHHQHSDLFATYLAHNIASILFWCNR
jgi:hypothetical protein